MGTIDFLKNSSGDVLYPVTLTNSVYNSSGDSLDKILSKRDHVTEVRLYASGWIGSTAPYTQQVTVSGAKSSMEPLLVSALEDGVSVDVQKSYAKAFAIISSGTAIVQDESVIFKVYQKPVTNITVGLRGI